MIRNITVIGAGTMGHGIALNFAMHGYKVRLYDSFPVSLEAAPERMRSELVFMADEGYITLQDVEDTLANITICSNLTEAAKDADFVNEAITEILDLKKELFAKLDEICPPHTVFASNTSSLKLFDMTADLSPGRQKLCMIAHWYNPAYILPIVELSKFGNMDEDVFKEVYDFFIKSGKKPVKILKDVPGMIANRLLHALAREAFRLVELGVGEPEDVDNALKYGPCFRNATTGMLEVADMGGLDIWASVEDNLFPYLEKSDRACDLMKSLVEEGNYGVKTGKGFFDYSGNRGKEVQTEFMKRLLIQLKASENY